MIRLGRETCTKSTQDAEQALRFESQTSEVANTAFVMKRLTHTQRTLHLRPGRLNEITFTFI